MKVSEAPQRALEHVREHAATHAPHVRNELRGLLRRVGVDAQAVDSAVAAIRACGRVALHFHPERLDATRTTVAEGLLRTGVYKSQYETGLSSGSPSAHPGGDRDRWEERLFGGAYHRPDAPATVRPKYGSLDLMRHPDGPSPRFGSSYFLLRPMVCERTTFTFLGSQEPDAPQQSGTIDLFEPVMGRLLALLERFPRILGPVDLTVDALLGWLAEHLCKPLPDPAVRRFGRVLDYYVEAQVHGAVVLERDVDGLVADAAFRAHPVGDVLRAMADRYAFPLQWHAGFRLALDDVPDEFRGYRIRPLAELAARDGVIDAASLGDLANALDVDPSAWRDRLPYRDILTPLRRLWHVLVLGTGAGSAPAPLR